MKAKRLISFVLAAAFMLSAVATPVFAAAALPQQTAAVEQENGIVSIRIKATGNLVYGSDYKLEVQTTPADTQYIGVVVGIGGEANGYVTLMLSDKTVSYTHLLQYGKMNHSLKGIRSSILLWMMYLGSVMVRSSQKNQMRYTTQYS